MASNTNKINFHKWRELISKHLGKSSAKQHRKIALDILCVDVGIKPAFLFDYACIAREVMENFIKDLHTDSLIRNKLQLLEMNRSGDIFICHPDFDVMIRNGIQSMKFVDVSSHLNQPQFVESGVETSLHESFSQVCSAVVKCDGIKYHGIDLSEDTNMTSMFGCLLGYPAVYWYHVGTPRDPAQDTHGARATEDTRGASAQGENCLAMEPLVNVQVTCTVNPDCLTGEDELQHVLWSFSYPACLQSDLSEVVRSWFSQVQQRVKKQNMFENVKMCEEHVTLLAVAL